jgi:hypothetical protein
LFVELAFENLLPFGVTESEAELLVGAEVVVVLVEGVGVKWGVIGLEDEDGDEVGLVVEAEVALAGVFGVERGVAFGEGVVVVGVLDDVATVYDVPNGVGVLVEVEVAGGDALRELADNVVGALAAGGVGFAVVIGVGAGEVARAGDAVAGEKLAVGVGGVEFGGELAVEQQALFGLVELVLLVLQALVLALGGVAVRVGEQFY